MKWEPGNETAISPSQVRSTHVMVDRRMGRRVIEGLFSLMRKCGKHGCNRVALWVRGGDLFGKTRARCDEHRWAGTSEPIRGAEEIRAAYEMWEALGQLGEAAR